MLIWTEHLHLTDWMSIELFLTYCPFGKHNYKGMNFWVRKINRIKVVFLMLTGMPLWNKLPSCESVFMHTQVWSLVWSAHTQQEIKWLMMGGHSGRKDGCVIKNSEKRKHTPNCSGSTACLYDHLFSVPTF